MKTIGIRVRPVIRHVITRWESEPETGSGSSGVLAEFDHESYADEVAQVLSDHYAPKVYVFVEETLGREECLVYYAYEHDYQMRVDDLKTRYPEKSFRVYSRIKETLGG